MRLALELAVVLVVVGWLIPNGAFAWIRIVEFVIGKRDRL